MKCANWYELNTWKKVRCPFDILALNVTFFFTLSVKMSNGHLMICIRDYEEIFLKMNDQNDTFKK